MKRLLRHSKLVLLTMVLALGGLVTATATPAAHAGSGASINTSCQISFTEVCFYGYGFSPDAQVRVEVLNSSLTEVLGHAGVPGGVQYVYANNYGVIHGFVSGNDMLCFQGYTGPVWVVADQLSPSVPFPSGEAWAQTYASFPATCTIRWH